MKHRNYIRWNTEYPFLAMEYTNTRIVGRARSFTELLVAHYSQQEIGFERRLFDIWVCVLQRIFLRRCASQMKQHDFKQLWWMTKAFLTDNMEDEDRESGNLLPIKWHKKKASMLTLLEVRRYQMGWAFSITLLERGSLQFCAHRPQFSHPWDRALFPCNKFIQLEQIETVYRSECFGEFLNFFYSLHHLCNDAKEVLLYTMRFNFYKQKTSNLLISYIR